MPTDDDLDALLKRLHLASARRIWRKLVEQAEKEDWSYRHFLGVLVAEEIAQRQQTRLQRLSRRAVFPFLKTIYDFNFSYQSERKTRPSPRRIHLACPGRRPQRIRGCRDHACSTSGASWARARPPLDPLS